MRSGTPTKSAAAWFAQRISAVLVHDDAVGAQLEQQAVAVGLLLQRLLGLAGRSVTSATTPTQPVIEPAGVEDRAGPDEQRPLAARRASRIVRSSS